MEICFEQLCKTWPDGTRALSDVDLTVPAGQFCVLLGHSGDPAIGHYGHKALRVGSGSGGGHRGGGPLPWHTGMRLDALQTSIRTDLAADLPA